MTPPRPLEVGQAGSLQAGPHLSADVQVIVLWFQVHLSDRNGLHFQPAIFLLVLSFPLNGPVQQLQVKVLLTLPLATEQEG